MRVTLQTLDHARLIGDFIWNRFNLSLKPLCTLRHFTDFFQTRCPQGRECLFFLVVSLNVSLKLSDSHSAEAFLIIHEFVGSITSIAAALNVRVARL